MQHVTTENPGSTKDVHTERIKVASHGANIE